jgi:DNA topoisomerase-1
VELPRALELIRLKKEADANRLIADFGVESLQVLNGRFGPYVTNGKKNAKIPKDRDPKTITLEEARVMIEQAPERGTGRFGRGKRPAAKGAAAAAPATAAAGNGVAAKGKSGARKKAPVPAASGKATAAPAPAAAKPPKVSRGAAPPKPKGVAHIVRKGRSAAAKAHARKKTVRPERTPAASGKSAPKRARGAKV